MKVPRQVIKLFCQTLLVILAVNANANPLQLEIPDLALEAMSLSL